MTGKRRFGRVRRLPSGRYQARYPGPDGVDRPAGQTFATKRAAEVWLTLKESEIKRGDWLDPSAGAVLFAKYAAEWMGQSQLSPKTAQLYELLLRLHLVPAFGELNIADIRQEDVRAWRAKQLRIGPLQDRRFGPVTVAKAYRLLRAVLNTAVRDRRIRENPCQIKGADKESSPERPVLSVPEVYRLAAAIEPRYRALILLATFGNLRWGELAGLRRRNLDLGNRTVRVVETVYELDRLVQGKPKSEASIRKVVLPELIIPDLAHHLEAFAAQGSDGFVFVGMKGGQLRRSNFSKPWARALKKAGLPAEIHVHDLRHTGNTLSAEAGASLAELMSRMGHSSARAAMVYLHARDERDRQLAASLDRMARRELKRSARAPSVARSGTQRARGAADRPTREPDHQARKDI
jgi:integrase